MCIRDSPNNINVAVRFVDANGNVDTLVNTGLDDLPYALSLGPNDEIYWVNRAQVNHVTANGVETREDFSHIQDFHQPAAVEYVASNDKVYVLTQEVNGLDVISGNLWELSSDPVDSTPPTLLLELGNDTAPFSLTATTIEATSFGPAVTDNTGLSLSTNTLSLIHI